MIPDWLNQLNAFLWIGSNVIVVYIAIALTIFTVGYYALFDPSKTTAGKLIFRFAVSLLGVISLIFIGVFLNPAVGREWFNYPGDLMVWRPALRFALYSYVAYTITSLTVFLWIRKYRPAQLKTSKDYDLVEPRNIK